MKQIFTDMKKITVKFILFMHLIVCIVFSTLISCQTADSIKLITPSNHIEISNNIPTFSWKTKKKFNSFEIWIDNILVDTVAGNQNLYVPFPLSFGEHQWQIVGILEGKKIKSSLGFFTVNDRPLTQLPKNSILLRHNWEVIAASQINTGGKELSEGIDNSQGWISTSVPTTVLSALVRKGIYPNPYVGLNNMRIPDSDDAYNKENDLLKYSHIPGQNPWKTPYWFKTNFQIPDSLTGKMMWLNFGEINYRAEVWLNGIKIADTATMVGMERQFKFEVTHLLKPEANFLAVAIFPVNNPGNPEPEPVVAFGEPGENMADGMISKDYTKWDALGWDWQPAVRDRDMGLVEDVFISAADFIEIENLYVTSDLNLPDTSVAEVTISADLVNHSNNDIQAQLTGTISSSGQAVSFVQNVVVKANETLSVLWNKNTVAELLISNPKLWWPIGYGEPNLYRVQLQLNTSSGEKAITETNFGIRKVETYIGEAERVYKINGREIYCKGGNWVIDMMLNWNAQRYEDEILLTKNSNLNLLRVWGPTGAPPDVFFDAADKHGILLWQDFLNDYWGTFKNSPGFIPNEELFIAATESIVKKYRNHPSLIIWCGGNEGPNPREKIIVEQILPKFDGRDSKHYLKISNGDGLHGGGPYHTMEPKEYFTRDQLHGFSSEIGPSGMPVYESMTKFLPQLGKTWAEGFFPVNGEWAFHDASDRSSDNRKFSFFDKQVRNFYGNPTSVEDYMDKSQLVNYDVYRASIESINRLLWDKASGIALWKSNSSWPSLTWQIYDWYMQAHAGYYGVKKASEVVHIQFNRDIRNVVVLNVSFENLNGVTLKADYYDSKLQLIWSKVKETNLMQNSVTESGWIVPDAKDVTFLKLALTNKHGKVLSDNFYWLNEHDDFKILRDLPAAELQHSLNSNLVDGKAVFQLSLKNTSNNLAFMLAVTLNNKQSGHEILPSYYSDNYFTILPNEQKVITIETEENLLDGEAAISYKAFNSIEKHTITPKFNQE